MESPKSETSETPDNPKSESQNLLKFANVRAADYFEQEFGKIPNAIALSKKILTAEELEELDLSKLEIVKSELFDDDTFFHNYPDKVYRIPYNNSEEFLDLYILFEHKSSSEPQTILQIFFYTVQIYMTLYKEHIKANSRGSFFLPEIIPVIYHTGKTPFRAAKNICEFFQDKVGKNKAKLFFEAQIRDLAVIPTEELELNPNELEFSIVERLMQGVHQDDIYQRVKSLQESLGQLAQDKANWDFLNLSFGFIGKNTNKISKEQYQHIFKQIEPTGESNMISLFDQIEAQGEARGKAQGKAEGKAEGEIRGKVKTLIRILQTKFHTVPQSTIERIHDIRDSVVLESLAVSAAMSNSLDEFLQDLN